MEIKINITAEEEKVLLNDILDIQDWVEKAVKGKINNCKKRMLAGWKSPLVEKTDEELIEHITTQPEYKNRAERDTTEE